MYFITSEIHYLNFSLSHSLIFSHTDCFPPVEFHVSSLFVIKLAINRRGMGREYWFLNLSTNNVWTIGDFFVVGDHPVLYRTISSISGLSPLDDSSAFPKCDNPKYL